MKILVSRCLMGAPCRYDAKRIINTELLSLLEGQKLYFICPEVEGGLPTPRSPAEIVGERVITSMGNDVTEVFEWGADIALERARFKNIDVAILKERSPSCGVNQIYDGTFSGSIIKGQGVTTRKLIQDGFRVFSEEELDEIKEFLRASNENPTE